MFSKDTSERKWHPNIKINDQTILVNNPTFLGITYDKQMTFGARCWKNSLLKSTVLTRLNEAVWGWARELMKTMYTAT